MIFQRDSRTQDLYRLTSATGSRVSVQKIATWNAVTQSYVETLGGAPITIAFLEWVSNYETLDAGEVSKLTARSRVTVRVGMVFLELDGASWLSQ
jgi:hypothetical protein